MTRNVVVCCLDTVRQDYFARFAPRLRERAAVTVPGCRAASGWSVPSHASMVTGSLPHEHGVHVYQPRFEALDREDTVFGDLPDHESLGVSANVYAGSSFGFDALFDRFVDVSRDHRFDRGLDVSAFVDDHPEPGAGRYLDVLRAAASHDHPLRSVANAACLAVDQAVESGPLSGVPTPFDDGAATVERAFTRLAADADGPFVGFCNFMEAHEPHRDTVSYEDELYDAPRGWRSSVQPEDLWGDASTVADGGRDSFTDGVADDGDGADSTGGPDADAGDRIADELSRYRSVYSASIEYLDRRLDSFVDRVQATTEGETTFVITADHGENLGTAADGGALGHVGSLSEGILNVPLLLLNPPEGYPSTVSGLVSHCDLRRLVRGLARGETPELGVAPPAAELMGPTPGNDALVDQGPDRWDRARRAVYDRDRKVVWTDGGAVTAYAVEDGRPCWQRRTPGTPEAQRSTVGPDPLSDPYRTPLGEPFDAPLADARDRARAADPPAGSPASDEGLTSGVEQRLEDLGYR